MLFLVAFVIGKTTNKWMNANQDRQCMRNTNFLWASCIYLSSVQNGEYADMTTKCDLSKSFCADTVTDNKMEHLQHLFTFKHAMHTNGFCSFIKKINCST